MERPSRTYLEFGRFQIDPDERVFLSDGRPVSLAPKVFDLLVLLAENAGHTLSKSVLMERLWPNSFVEENSLNRNVSILRRVLGDDRKGQFIRTVPKVGYRLEADVHRVIEDEEELVVEKRTNYNVTFRGGTSTAGAVMSRRTLAIAAAICVVAVVVVAGWSYRSQSEGLKARKAEAYEKFDQGRKLWQDRSPSGLHEATLLLEKSIELDPDLAVAHAALADAYAFDVRNSRRAEETAERAIALDPRLGAPYATIGFLRLFWQWNPTEAEPNFKKAISLSPEYATAHQWYGLMLASVGHFNEGLAEMKRALELEPNAVAINADMCQMLYFAGRNYEAEAQCKRTLELDPNFSAAHSHLYSIYSVQGRHREAAEAFFTRERLSVNSFSLPADFELLRAAFDRGGIEEFWRELVRLRARGGSDCGFPIAWIHANLGEADEAVKCLKNAAANRDFDLIFIYADPVLRSLRASTQYRQLADAMMRSELKTLNPGD